MTDDLVKRLRDPRWVKHNPEAADEIERLRAALQEIANGGPNRVAAYPFRDDEIPSKNDLCEHYVAMWDDCSECVAKFARAALGEKKDGKEV